MTRSTESTSVSTPEAVLSEPAYGWYRINGPLSVFAIAKGKNVAEAKICDHLDFLTQAVMPAGSRHQRFDVQILDSRWNKSDIPPGKYEIKSLYRRRSTHAFDRRIKTGSRGETIYGRYDALIKAFALDVESYIDVGWQGGVRQLTEMYELIDAALERRHSRSFREKIVLLAEAYDDLYSLSSASALIEAGSVQPVDIARGFDDISGIFVVAGDLYTIVTKAEFGSFFEFDSVSVEGVKLRYNGWIPT